MDEKLHNTYELAMEDDYGGANIYGALYANENQLDRYIERNRKEFYREWFAYISENGDD
jgi:hypothetical protein